MYIYNYIISTVKIQTMLRYSRMLLSIRSKALKLKSIAFVFLGVRMTFLTLHQPSVACRGWFAACLTYLFFTLPFPIIEDMILHAML